MRIQAFWRGYQARKAFAPVWREYKDGQRERQAALAIQTVSTGGRVACAHASIANRKYHVPHNTDAPNTGLARLRRPT